MCEKCNDTGWKYTNDQLIWCDCPEGEFVGWGGLPSGSGDCYYCGLPAEQFTGHDGCPACGGN